MLLKGRLSCSPYRHTATKNPIHMYDQWVTSQITLAQHYTKVVSVLYNNYLDTAASPSQIYDSTLK